MEWIPNTIGIVGVVLILLAYYLLQTNRYSSADLGYLKLNAAGSILLLYSLYFHWNLASVIVEAVWLIITVWSMLRVARQRTPASQS